MVLVASPAKQRVRRPDRDAPFSRDPLFATGAVTSLRREIS